MDFFSLDLNSVVKHYDVKHLAYQYFAEQHVVLVGYNVERVFVLELLRLENALLQLNVKDSFLMDLMLM